MKKLRILTLTTITALMLTAPVSAAEGEDDFPEISAMSAVLMDADSARVLWEQNGEEPRLIASTTKIMTALLALEHLDPDRIVTIDPDWTGIEGSTMYLRPGQRLTVRELLYGLMLASGNDAAEALACLTAGSAEAFAELMNRRAKSLGCEHTHFENPSGLDGERHYSSAHDLALIAREAIKNDTFRAIASTYTASVGELAYTNHNRLLRECEGVFGVKTGYTEAAGRTLVSCCERNGITLICVTLSDPDDWRDHTALYDWAYENYLMESVTIPRFCASVSVIGGETESVSLVPEVPVRVLRRADESIMVSAEIPAFVYASVEQGAEAGTLTVTVDGAKVGRFRLVYGEGVGRIPEEKPALKAWLSGFIGMRERKIYTLT